MHAGENLIPPQNIDVEKSLLGSLLLDKDAIIKVADILVSKDFYEERHGIIFATMLALYEKMRPIDVVTVSNSLKDKKQLETIGGASYLTTISSDPLPLISPTLTL